jgi:NADH-quinone oxidoreductase subunit L
MGDEHHGEDDHGDDHHGHDKPHAPRWAINTTLVLICVGAVLSIFLFHWGGDEHHPRWSEMMVAESSAAGGVAVHGDHGGGHAETGFWSNPHSWMPWIASLTTLVGIAIALYFHLLRRTAADSLKAVLLGNPVTGWLPRAMENKWYVDEFYHAVLRAPLWILGHVLSFLDKYLLDFGIIDGLGRLPRGIATLFRPLTNGVLQSYAVSMAGGVGLVILLVIWMPELIQWLNRVLGQGGGG